MCRNRGATTRFKLETVTFCLNAPAGPWWPGWGNPVIRSWSHVFSATTGDGGPEHPLRSL